MAEQELAEIKRPFVRRADRSLTLAPGLRKALFVALFLAVVSELSGITVVFYYGPGILEKAGFRWAQRWAVLSPSDW